ncbi:trypsin-like peptidase domain-containing protein, partial [Acidobacteria bacterium AH-259-A15]|nr:trypsin-like peptidase domain-containing protein [Acidobacteria bacterium AH-259-A15]
MKEFLRSKKGITFLALFITLLLGIAIGTLVPERVMSAEQTTKVALLETEGEGSPLVLAEAANLAEGFARVAKTVEPAVVNISTTAVVRTNVPQRREGPEDLRKFFGDDFWERFFGPMIPPEQKATSLGSGVIVDSKGYILTNYHVVTPPPTQRGVRQITDKIKVTLQNGDTYVARVLGEDPESDLAVLKISASKPLPFAKVGDTSKMQVGEWVLAVGNPFGVGQTVTSGIVSATGRVVRGTTIFGDYIQTDAAINPGNSGGPLVNMRGEVIGINTLIFTRSGGSQGVGFAIPSSVFVNSYNQIVTTGKIERGWLGVSMNTYPMNEGIAKFFGVAGNDPEGIKDGDGVLVVQVIDENGDPAESGPAYEAGVRAEDVIVKFGDREIETRYDLRFSVANTPSGEEVPFTVVRRGKVLQLNVTLAERTIERRERAESEGLSFEERKEEEREKEIGLVFETLSARDAERLGLDNERGVLIRNVIAGSLADEARLEPNQVITNVNGDPVRTATDLYEKINSMASGTSVVLRLVWPQDGHKGVGYTS